MLRCKWPTLDQWDIYQQYHDEEWGVASQDDGYLFEMLLLESFHCGLSWLLILRKREAFRQAFHGFSPEIIAGYGPEEVACLMENPGIVRNESKIRATIENARSFLQIQEEFGSFSAYLWGFTQNQVQYYPFDGTTKRNALSDRVAKDLKKRGFRFMGSVTTFSYLEAVGVMNNHADYCCCYPGEHPNMET